MRLKSCSSPALTVDKQNISYLFTSADGAAQRLLRTVGANLKMTKNRILHIILFVLTFMTLKGQESEFEIRTKFIGQIINDPETPELTKLIQTYFEKRDSLWSEDIPPPYHCAKNCLQIELINDTLLIESEPSTTSNLRHRVYRFLKNPTNDIMLSDSIPSKNELGQTFYLSKGVIYIAFDTLLTETLEKVIKETAKGIKDYKYDLAKNIYNQKYKELSSIQKSEVDSAVNWKLTLSNIIVKPPPPPPFPDSLKNNMNLKKIKTSPNNK